jgi:predicted  nucleic acid-binding Zn-ribbon protein
MYVARPLSACFVAVAAAQVADPRTKTCRCVRCGIDFERSVRADRPLKVMCNDCKAVAPRFLKGHDHGPSAANRIDPAHDEAACSTADDR